MPSKLAADVSIMGGPTSRNILLGLQLESTTMCPLMVDV